ncbi:MAG TPA: hypothetical protein VMF52_02035 [Steroidobacteraceae bacterium]|nr:hypothetical protein [Steroidobacteraceae bacterium]
MKKNVRGWSELTVRNVACLAFGALLAGCASDSRPVVVGQPIKVAPLADYCANAQTEIAQSRVPARNVIVTDFAAFSRATPSIKPLETLQYVGYTDDKQTKARMISCKLHSAERIRAEYGATAAGEPTTCARLNRRTLDAVMLTLSDRQRKKMPFNGALPVALDPDEQSATEAQWLEGFTMVQTDAGGTLRIRAKSLRAGNASLRRTSTSGAASGDGRQYCHLIAPDYLKRILIGDVQLPKAEFPAAGQTAAR